MFQENDNFDDSLDDDFITKKVFPIFDKYPRFIDTKIDALGAVYEVLAIRAEKDVKIGQFFTPEKVVDFIVKLADLNYKDIVLDPACGTGRFLIYAMENIEQKLKASEERDKKEFLKNIHASQLYGSDIDSRIAKIAKMNMWIHGDGKSNIYKHNGLILNQIDANLFNEGIDVVLTNPPLGNLNYQENYDEEFKKNNPILPRKNITKEEMKKQEQNLQKHEEEKQEIQNEIDILKENADIKTIIEFESENSTPSEELKILKEKQEFKDYKKLISKIKRKENTIKINKEKLKDIEAKIRTNQCEYKITGTSMKGGALFLSSIKNYLKSERLHENLPEWKGGVLVTIIDEGILNTEDYSLTRKFLKENFYIKAIISLTRDTFVPVSNTSTKTSILYAIKKQDTSSKQQEPIFYGYVDKVGMNTKGKVCENHFDTILNDYEEFKKIIFESYEAKQFNRELFESKFKSRQLNDKK